MGFFETLTGKKTFCSVCGVPVGSSCLRDATGEPLCSEACRDAMQRFSNAPPAMENAPEAAELTGKAPASPSPFPHPELVVFVFRTNTATAFFSLQDELIVASGEPKLQVQMWEGQGVSLVVVNGPAGSIQTYRRTLRTNLGRLAKAAKCRPERIRPDVTYSNVSEMGEYHPDDKAIQRVCDKIRRGAFRRRSSTVLTSPAESTSPPTPRPRTASDQSLLRNAIFQIDKHVTFDAKGEPQVQLEGVREAARLLEQLADRHPSDPEPATLETSAVLLDTQHARCSTCIETLVQRFPDHAEARMIAMTRKSIFAFPPYDVGASLPDFLRKRIRGATLQVVRQGCLAHAVLFVESSTAYPTSPAPVAYPLYVQSAGIPVFGVAVVFADGSRVETTVAGFEEHDGHWSLAPKACYLLCADTLPVVTLVPWDAGSPKRANEPLSVAYAVFDPTSREAFVGCEATYRGLQPRAFPLHELSSALQHFRDKISSIGK
ncbi:MAG TPA: hypothetical protein PLJ27_06160 [Polyangiaceae bacterium]|jgi:hypothetical protein|nr:MAG: hypothetical protein BWY17_01776 [Deltaproteobacteria bacterium ADurb.Bin207]HNS98508.1 hypothetical protein [Polyangiaceae bacterium]HNZ23946.1 hypothetical protein [Polyangiaceae bacterium]HOD21803.1 hypothetical protein [Polyangiaceae bacterium]HOE49513.1 hypothetical protein [Polyangiaceae bacterium]